jgi:hypothetical protein
MVYEPNPDCGRQDARDDTECIASALTIYAQKIAPDMILTQARPVDPESQSGTRKAGAHGNVSG